MKKHSISYKLILVLIFIGSCIDPLKVDIKEEVDILVVEGGITTQPGPHYIILSRSLKYDATSGLIKSVNSASVVIRDSDGNNYTLVERIGTLTDRFGYIHPVPTGIYNTTDNFSAVVGKSYTLLITTTDGIEYTSLPETIKQGSKILKLNADFRKIPIADTKNTVGPIKAYKFKTGLEISVTTQDNPGEEDFYMWENNSTYQISTFPEKYLARPCSGCPRIKPAPKDCCTTCWINELADRKIRLLKDNNVNGNIINTKVAFIEDDGLRFSENRYLVRVEQYSLSREAFQFFQLLKGQLSIDGDIFDPPPATIRGNMINLSNPDENVIGYFRASDISVDSIFLTNDMLLERRPLQLLDDDCRVFRNGTTERPPYW